MISYIKGQELYNPKGCCFIGQLSIKVYVNVTDIFQNLITLILCYFLNVCHIFLLLYEFFWNSNMINILLSCCIIIFTNI